jgi:hypothetical protein
VIQAELPSWTRKERRAIQSAIGALSPRFTFGKVSDGDYGYGLILPEETTRLPQKQQLLLVQKAAAAWRIELVKRGIQWPVSARTAHNPKADPPYIVMSKLDKSVGAKAMLKAAGVEDDSRVVVLGDSFMPPNQSDERMAEGAPGALTISLGEGMDPRVPNGYLWNRRGPAGTLQILRALAETK